MEHDPKEVTVTVRMEESLRDDFKRLAGDNDRSFSAELRRALRLYVLSHTPVADAADAQ